MNDRLQELKALHQATGSILAEVLIHTLEALIAYRPRDRHALFGAATAALKCSGLIGNYYYMVRAYSALGTYHGTLGNILTAFDCFWNARSILRDHRDELLPEHYAYLNEIVQNDIGCCLIYSEEYRMALDYFPEDDIFDTGGDLFKAAMQRMNAAICHFRLGETETAYRIVHRLRQTDSGSVLEPILRSSLLVWDYILSCQTGNREDAERLYAQLDESVLSAVDPITAADLLRFVLDSERYENFLPFYDVYLKNAIAQQNIGLQVQAYGFLMQYYEAVGDQQGYDEACMQAGRLSILRDREEAQVRRASIRTYIQVAEKSERQKELEKSRELLQHKSEFDELTGLANRYKLSEFCDSAFERAISGRLKLCVEILDVDFFKRVNDNYGHTQGDVCLKRLAEEIQKSVTDPDRQICARYGGDEFIIVRLGEEDEAVRKDMERLRKAVAALGIPNAYSDVAPVVTVSQGAVNRIPAKGDGLLAFLKVADENLYQAKKISKNTVVLCGDEGTPSLHSPDGSQ